MNAKFQHESSFTSLGATTGSENTQSLDLDERLAWVVHESVLHATPHEMTTKPSLQQAATHVSRLLERINHRRLTCSLQGSNEEIRHE